MILTWERYRWVRQHFDRLVLTKGPNKAYQPYPRFPELAIISDPGADSYGWFDQERVTIVINVAGCTEDEILGTLRHEYKHYLQDPDRTDVEQYETEAQAAEMG